MLYTRHNMDEGVLNTLAKIFAVVVYYNILTKHGFSLDPFLYDYLRLKLQVSSKHLSAT